MDPSGDADLSLLEDFGQRVDLTRRIREVLVNYPEGTTVLKELIQNADDAGATRICLCLDRRTHGAGSLLSGKLAQCQGPALLAYNDAMFTEDDFASISRIGDSKKQSQAWKTGRFGVGFNSVYHLTDLPSFVSDKYVVLFDPQGAYLPNVSAANPGKRLEYVNSSAILLYKDQFMPYCAFGCDMKGPFPGTLFRFPLRNADQAAISRLSRQAYSEDDISSMFSQLYKEAVFTMLFLKSIISVEMYVWETGAREPQKIYSCSVRLPNENTAWHRQALARFSSTAKSSNWQTDSFSLDFLSETFSGANSGKRIDSFFIVQAMASASSKIGSFAATAANDYELHLLPWASVAACISDGLPEDNVLKQGQAFCFLPLPVRTGLPVQVNGYFEVSSNRRSIWYGADMDRGGKLRSDWNRLLLEDVVAPAFNELLLGLRKLLGPTKRYYSLWPSGAFEEPWHILVERIYKVIYSSPVLYSDFEGQRWIPPAEAFVHDEEFSKSNDLGKALVLLGMPIVHLPSILVDTLFKYYANFHLRVVSPITVRHFLKECKTLVMLSRSFKLVLLEYSVSDLVDADVGNHANGLPLLPLANGQFGVITEASQGISCYVCNELEYKLLSVVPDKIIDQNIPADLYCRLSEIAKVSGANISYINGQTFLQFFPSFFPTEWKYENRVLWNPDSGATFPTAAWFVLFWQYLQDQSYDLSIFREWPILPSTTGHLHKSSKFSKLINAEFLSCMMRELLTKVGCKILDVKYGIEHQQLSLYVYDGNAAGVLSSIFEAVSSNDNQLQLLFQDFAVDEKNELRHFLLDPKWYHGGSLSDLDIKNCKKLPIFRVHAGGHTHTSQFSDLECFKKYLPPVGILENLLGGEFILCTSQNEEDILLRYYGIERMRKTTFYRQNVIDRVVELEPEVRDAVMLSILQDLPQLCLEDSSFKELLKRLTFVPTIHGSLKSPQSLYDPRVDELLALLEESDCFPSGLFQEPGVLDMLLLLGLRTSVSTDTIIQSARQVESLMHKDQLKAYSRGKVLLSYLEVNPVKWLHNMPNDSQSRVNGMFSKVATALRPRDMPIEADLEKFWSDLRMICWCPVLVTAPHPALPWPSVSSMVAPPKLVRLQVDMWLVSASTRILDGECSSSALSFSLGWSSPPSGSVIAAQLLELGKNNEIVTDQALRQELALAMPKVYSLLTNLIGSDEMDIVKAVLEGCRWIWVGDGFATVNEVVLNGHLHLVPYIRVIPVDLAVFRELFLELGIKEFLNPTDYTNILYRMAMRKGSTPLDVEELRMTALVVQHLAETQFQDLQVQIYLPDVSSRLLPSSDLVFNDAPWLLDVGESAFGDTSNVALNSMRNVHNFVHGNISNDVAEKLGVRSLRGLLLAESSDSVNLSLSGVAEAFGQHEALTTRLKHIVEMYADGPGILFELVQNAEDAQASEVVFLLDKTQYGTSSILSPEMAEWQGPALYCFNDSVFSPQDLYAISRIGQDSKLEKPFAIGRFGLGFNCVYHFTDIPGFVSGENIVIFDPHACYLPGISPTHPGLRIRFVGRRILEQFPDQFTPFLHFGCDLQQSFPGTLFRFPLRGETAASRSQIKKEKYAPEDVELLFSSFSEVVSETLLFLRNVKKITLFVKDGTGHEMQLIHHVSRHNISRLVKEPHPLHSMLNFMHGNRRSGTDRDQFLHKLDKTVDRDLPWDCQKVAVVEQSPFGYMSHFWIISECIGGGHAKNKSITLRNRSRNFIPWACVAAYLHSANLKDVKELSNALISEGEFNGFAALENQPLAEAMQDRKKIEGRAFCFLPLPINTGLPVHVNAYFELSSNRRDIWFGNDMAGGGRVRSEWNTCLLEDVIAPAYGHLLAVLAEQIGLCDLFYSFWPTTIGVEPWASLVQKLYKSIADLGLPVLYTKARGGQWISTRRAIFPDFTFPKAVELAEALSEAGLPMVLVSKQIVDRFMEACPSLHFLNPQLLRTLLIRRKRGFKNKEAVILTLEYCLNDLKGVAISDKLQGLPLVPLANGSFTTFNKRGEGERIFIVSQKEFDLLKNSVPHLLIDCCIPDGIFSKLHDIAHSGQSNLYVFTYYSLVELFPRLLPTEWQHAKQVSWTPGHQGQPSMEWIGLLWSYLKESCMDLSMFTKWPILPVGNGCLMKLVENSNVIRDDGWSENMYMLLRKIGCFLLWSDLPVDHPQLKNFVQDATACGVLNAVHAVASQPQNVKGLFVNASVGELHELRSFIFQSKWFSGNQMTSSQIDMIKLLPIFESYKSRELTSLVNPTKWLKSEGIHEDLLNENFIWTESEKEKSILSCYIGIKEPTKAEFYKEHVLERMPEFLSQPSILSSILLDVKFLNEVDTAFKTALSETHFVLAANGSWRHPSRLYDPRVPSLHNLLHKEVFFPSEKFQDAAILESLASLGLRKTLSFTALLDSARSVSMLHDSGSINALIYGKRLLVYLNALGFKLSNANIEEVNHGVDNIMSSIDGGSHDGDPQSKTHEECDQEVFSFLSNFDHDQSEDEFWSQIKVIAWCPVYVTAPHKELPWSKSGDCIAPPNVTRPKSQMWIVSSKMRILDGDCCSDYLQQKLGWMDLPNIRVLSTQLIELSKLYNKLKLQVEQEPPIDSVLGREIPSIYSKLQKFIGTNDFKVVKEDLDGVPWVYIGDNFVSTKALAFDSPVKYHPYLYVVPSELSEFRALLSELGVKLTFDAMDYLHVLQCLQCDLKGEPLSSEQLNFVHRVLEAFADCYADKQGPDVSLNSLLIPDSSGVLMHASNLVYNDAPWMTNNNPTTKHFVHSSISDDLANRLGVQSLRSLSLVDDEMMKDLPCMDYARICELLAFYRDSDFLLFDLLELADLCNAKKLRLIYDKREHPRQSLLQQNLGHFQGSALTVVLEGTTLSREEICGLQLPPPWKIRGNAINYGLGLVSSYFVCDLLTIVSGGYFYIFDPLGLALAAPSNTGSSAKLFSLTGTDLTERFRDQFSPMLVTQDISSSSSNSTVIRMPLSSKCTAELETACKRVNQIFDRFMQNASSTLLFLRSILQVSLLTWEEGNLHPTLNYAVSIDQSFAILRNPFSEKKWRKFQLSRLFTSSSAVIKMHVIDVHVIQGGSRLIDKWLVVLCLGSGQTRNMALDRRYLAYNLTPVAGVAAHISQNGQPISAHTSSCILSPLPLSGTINMPVTVLGYFLVCHNGGRYLFNSPLEMTFPELQHDARNQLIDAWNKELMLCVRDSYVEMVLEFQKLRKDPLNSTIESNSARAVSSVIQAYGDRLYSFWPRSKQQSTSCNELDAAVRHSSSIKAPVADWELLIEQVIRPFYVRLVDLPVWQLYHGNVVKADEGMFLSQSDSGEGDKWPPSGVYSFIKELYPVFSVPWELVREIQAVGIKVREIRPKMVRNLLKASPSVPLRSIETYIEVLEYCVSDIQLQKLSNFTRIPGSVAINDMQVENVHMSTNMAPSSSNTNMTISHHALRQSSGTSGGDALDLMTYFGKALYDFGRGVVEDIGRAGGPLAHRATAGSSIYMDEPFLCIVADLYGMPFPSATKCLTRLGTTELWIGSKEQQLLMRPLADNFIHPQCLEKPSLAAFLSNQTFHSLLKLKNFSPHLLSSHLRHLFSERWVNRVMDTSKTPWVSWDNMAELPGDGPSPEWIRLFWKIFRASNGELSLVADWPLIPAFLDSPGLCRVKEHHLVFVPPITDPTLLSGVADSNRETDELLNTFDNDIAESDLKKLYHAAFQLTKSRYPWLFTLLSQFKIPLYDISFLDCDIPCNFFPAAGQTLGQVIASKLLAAKNAGYFSMPPNLSNENCDRLFTLFTLDFRSANGCVYKREELEVLRELPIYKTVVGTYTRLSGPDLCIVSPTSFFHPCDERCLSNSIDSILFYHALGVSELSDQEVLVRFALPRFERKTSGEQEEILLYLYTNWKNLQLDSTVLSTLKETNFVHNANELCTELFKPRELLDPYDSLLMSVFSGERDKFPGERFTTDGWLRILKKTGLRTSSQDDVIVECAKKIETLGSLAMEHIEDPDDFEEEFSSTQNEIPFEIWSLAESVVDSIFTNFATLYDNAFCEKLGKIAFVPAEKGFPSVGGKKGGKRVLSSYREAILLKDWPLAWSSAPILAKQNVVPPEYSWAAFRLRSPPAFSPVLKHLQVVGRDNGEDTLAHWPTSSGMITVEYAFLEILKYLDKVWGTLSSSDMAELQKMAFVPVANGTRLVTVKSLFVHLTINLSPFAFELPSLYLPFVRILKEIGLQEVLTISYARDFLLSIQKACGYQRLNPNELRAVMEILNFICSGATAISDAPDWITDAIVPDDGCRLVLARSCVYVDPYGAQFLGNIDTSRLRFAHPELPDAICMALGIKKLSDIVVEELDEEHQLQVVHQIGNVPVNKIIDKLLSKSLQDAVCVLINSITNHLPSFEGLSLLQIQSSLEHMAERLKFVQSLYTRFCLLPKLLDITRVVKGYPIPEWGGSTRNRTIYFVDKSRTRILVADPPSFMTIYDVVANVVSQVLGAPAILPIGPLFACPDGSEKTVLKVLKLGSEIGVINHEGRTKILVGKELLPQDALQVQFLPLRPFYTGEIVAWKTGRDGEKLRYGRVPEDVRPSAGQTLYRFPVETASGETQVLLSTQVFSFRSVSVADASSLSSLPGSSKGLPENKMLHGQASKDAGRGKAAIEVSKELQYGKVSATELVQAVHDMLSAAGINMDAEKQTLLQTTLDLQEQLKESQVGLLVEQEKADAAIKEADAAKTAWSCRVCLNAEVNIAVVPCGHVLCHRCSAAVTRCPFCRTQVSRTMKIFRP
ncbi:sacsin [Phoenix dactylifera]|uniref:Sacsin n=1 Tax=Phoenix dactylifera TaxID=42345 RepID=A0A8B7CP48_PHODC|nr:sacsin [Phoenix dactylifera]